jgi:hypothetical protein
MANQNQKLNDNAYQDMFKKELDKAGRGIGTMSPKEKQDFFNKIDDKYKAKNEEVSKVVPAGSHKMPDGTIMKDKDHKNEEDAYDKDDEKPKSKPKKEEVKEKDLEETHTGQTKKANNHQKSANGEKEIIKSGAKLKFKEAYKKVKENQTTTDDSTQDRANQGDSLDDNSKDPDIKKPKGKADTGSKPTPVDTSPEIEYKN